MGSRFHGIIVPMVTPFRRDLSLDRDGVSWLARRLASQGVHGLFPNSTTGEFVHLSREEAVSLVEAVLDAAGGKAWVLPGITANSTQQAVELGRAFRDLGVDGVIAAPPYFFKPSSEALEKHFSAIAERVELPLIVYNIPSTTGVNIPVEVYARLVSEHSNVVGAKVTLDSLTYLRRLVGEVKALRRGFSVFTGMDDHLLPALLLGGDGGVVALANVAPRIHLELYESWRKGRLEEAVSAYRKILSLARIYDVASSFPTAVKTALKALGAPLQPYVRPPLLPEPPEVEEAIRRILVETGVGKEFNTDTAN